MHGRMIFNKHFVSEITVENVCFSMLANAGSPDNEDLTEMMIVKTPHIHAYCELFICGSGSIYIPSGRGMNVIPAGQAAFIPPSVEHCGVLSAGSDYAVMGFSCEQCRSNARSNLYSLFRPFMSEKKIINVCGCRDIYEQVKILNSFIDDDDHYAASMQFASILVSAAGRYSKLMSGENGNGRGNSGISQMEKLEQLINNRFVQKIRLSDIAREMFISERQVSRLVKKQFGKNFSEVIQNKRLCAAEQLLKYTDLTVEQAAQAAGFGSISNFYKCFAEKYGESPAQFSRTVKS